MQFDSIADYQDIESLNLYKKRTAAVMVYGDYQPLFAAHKQLFAYQRP
ncbi:hypothetical protein [Psychromonas sp.]